MQLVDTLLFKKLQLRFSLSYQLGIRSSNAFEKIKSGGQD